MCKPADVVSMPESMGSELGQARVHALQRIASQRTLENTLSLDEESDTARYDWNVSWRTTGNMPGEHSLELQQLRCQLPILAREILAKIGWIMLSRRSEV